MKKVFYVYVAQPKKGLYEASMPWVAELAIPIKGSSPAQLKEELMFRLIELVHETLAPEDLDRLIPPIAPYLTSVYVEFTRQIDPDRPPVTLAATTHVVIGSLEDDGPKRIWVPKIPGACITLNTPDDFYSAVYDWAQKWADANLVENLDALATTYTGQIDAMEVDLGFPTFDPNKGTPADEGRLTRPTILQQVSTNLSHRAQDESLPPAYGRDKLVSELVEALMSTRPGNICLVGPPGVGKTAIIHEAAKRGFHQHQAYQGRRDIWQTSGDRIIAGMSIIGQWEQRVEALCRELSDRTDVLFIEDLLGTVRAGRTSHGDSNVARFIEPYLEQDQFSIIAEATEETWALARSMAPGFVDKFRRIQVPELSPKDTLSVLSELIRDIEGHHPVRYTADAVETVLELGRRFFHSDAFPGKAVRLIKQCQYDALRTLNDDESLEEARITPATVARVVNRQTGLPVSILRPGTGRTSKEIRAHYDNHVFGQPDSVNAVTSLVTTIEQGLSDPGKPLGSFLFIGPSGVGKTETARALSVDLFGSVDRMVRFDMSEFSESMALTRLIGTPRNPDGELTSKVRLQPYCVLLFDEIEKAHPLVLDLLLQVLGDGRLTDAAGRVVDFRNCIAILTSNLGANSEDRWLGFSDATDRDRLLHYRRAAEDFFRPELFNRIDAVVPFRPLGKDALRRIARRTLQSLLERRGLRQAQVMVDVDETLIDYLAEKSVDPRYGARTLAHRVERLLIAPLAERLVDHTTKPTGITRVLMSPAPEGVRFDLQSLDLAPQVHKSLEDFSSDAAINLALEVALTRVEAIQIDPSFVKVKAEYDDLLTQINQTGQKGWQADVAEGLRQREHIIKQLDQLEKRLVGMQDPRGTGEFMAVAGENKTRTHKLQKTLREVRQELIWIIEQVECVARNSTGATLVFKGLSGPFLEDLQRWMRWMHVVSAAFSIEILLAVELHDGWKPFDPKLDLRTMSAFAVSSDTPGSASIFSIFAGYMWTPRPASSGQHALVQALFVDNSHRDAQALSAAMSQRRVEASLDGLIEFTVSEGQIEDIRTGNKWPIPEDRGQNLQQLLSTLVTLRLQ